METNKREGFASNFGFIMAAVGSAVGLGNIWGFPFKMGRNGGFAFLLMYLVLAIFIGLAVMIGELAIGRKTGMSPIQAYKKLSKKYAFLGWFAVASPFIILCFYCVLGGMVMRFATGYLLVAMFDIDIWNAEAIGGIANFFSVFKVSGTSMIIWTLIFMAVNVLVVSAGVGGGIEKFCNIGMPCLFVLLIVVIIYVAVQPGAGAGYQFMFGFNLEPLKENFLGVLSTAAGQMFFSLSLAMGAMINYGSYLSKSENIQKNSVIIVVMDTLVAIMAGMIVMPACDAFGVDKTGGPGLLFQSMQIVFDKMGGIGNLMGFMFYFLVFIAALSSSMSLLEACTAAKIDADLAKGKDSSDKRKTVALILAAVIFVFTLPIALDGIGSGLAGGASVPTPAELFGLTDNVKGWNDCWLDFYDMISEGLLMPIGALIMTFAIGWVWKMDNTVISECEADGSKFWGKGFFMACYKFIAPVGLLIVLYGQLHSFFGI